MVKYKENYGANHKISQFSLCDPKEWWGQVIDIHNFLDFTQL